LVVIFTITIAITEINYEDTSIFSFRLFSCGTSKEGESHLVEWNESEGAIKRTYSGFKKRSLGVVQFDTTRNRFLAAGDAFQIKFWDMDNTNMLMVVDADGGLLVSFLLPFHLTTGTQIEGWSSHNSFYSSLAG
jgi:hypothetical protein